MPDVEERMDFYHSLYGKILKKVSATWPKNSIDITGQIFQEIAKDLRSEMISQMRRKEREINEGRNQGNQNEETENYLATKKQRQTMHKFGVKKIPDDLSKTEASGILEELFDLSRHGNQEILRDKVENLNEQWR